MLRNTSRSCCHSIIKWQTLTAGPLRIAKLKMLLNKQIAYEGYIVLFIVEQSEDMFAVYLQCYSGSIEVERKMPYLTKRSMQSPGSACFLVLLRRDKAEQKSKGNIKIKSKRKISAITIYESHTRKNRCTT